MGVIQDPAGINVSRGYLERAKKEAVFDKENFINTIEKKEPEQTPPQETTTPEENSIDKLLEFMKEQQARIEAREDTSYSRAIEDLKRSGVNPNLLGSITPAESKGVTGNVINGITNLTTTEMNNLTQKFLQEMEHEFKMDENQKDRIANIFKALIGGGSAMGAMALR